MRRRSIGIWKRGGVLLALILIIALSAACQPVTPLDKKDMAVVLPPEN